VARHITQSFNCENRDQGSISPTFYNQLLQEQIPKMQKETDDLTVFLRFWNLQVQKLLINMLVKLTPDGKWFI
jgi:hypothetical protein